MANIYDPFREAVLRGPVDPKYGKFIFEIIFIHILCICKIFFFLGEILKFKAWNISEVAPSLDWSQSPLPPPYKILDYNLFMEIVTLIIINLRLVCKYRLWNEEVLGTLFRVVNYVVYPAQAEFSDTLATYAANEYETLEVSFYPIAYKCLTSLRLDQFFSNFDPHGNLK